MKKIFSKEVIIGLAVIASLAILFVGIDYLKGINVFKPSNFYIAKYNNVTGLAVSSPVTINGFTVGLVREINYEYENNGVMSVELSLDKELKLPKGSKAVLVTDLLGTANIQIQLAEASDYYEVGDIILSENKKGLMDDVNSKIMPAFVQILPKIDSIVGSLNALLANPALNGSITRLDKISANLEQTTTNLNRMVAIQLPATMGNVSQISSNLNIVTRDLAVLSKELKDLPLDTTIKHVNATAKNLNYATEQLTKTESSMGLLLNDRGLYDHVNVTMSNIDSLLIDLKKHPKKYVNFKLF